MKSKFIICVGLLYFAHTAFSQTYTPIDVTGFTHDAFAEAGTNAQAVTTTSYDATNHIMYTQAFAAANGITGGVLNTGTIVSGTRTYQLAPFTGNNALYLSLNGSIAGTTASGTLNLATPASYSRISFLSFSTEGNSTLNVVLNFSDGTTFNAGNFTFVDWFNGAGALYSAFGRIPRLATAPYAVDGLPTNPRWYGADIPISCDNQSKLLQSVTINYFSASGISSRGVVLAMSGVAYTQLTAATTVTPASCGNSNGSISVTATGGTDPLSYVWNTVPAQFGPTANGLAAGTYTATVSDANGCSISVPGTIPQSAVVTATATANPETICAGDTATLTATTTGGGNYTYTWSPGGATGSSIRVYPADTTTYTVTVADASGCSTTATIILPVKPRPVATFSTSPLRFCMRNTDTVRFTGTAGPGAGYNWDFGSGTVVSGTGVGPYVLQFPAGTHSIRLVVAENGCNSDTATRTVTADAASVANFTLQPTSICSGDTVLVNFSGTAAATATATWNWGGGTVVSGTGFGPYRVRYLSAGAIRLIVTNNTCVDSAAEQTVTVTPAPVAAFTPGTLQGCSPLTVSFVNNSQNGSTYSWDFGDAGSSALQTPAPHTYTNVGSYNVVLTVTNGNCSSTSAPQTIAVVPPPVAGFSSTPPATATPLQISQALFAFSNLSQGATAYRWYFGDGDSSSQASPTHRYTRAGSFTVRLYAFNNLGCADSISIAPYIIIPDSSLRIPNAFSPNGDGVNDTWQIPGLLGYPDARMEVFDRYGQIVYRSTGYTTPWNGQRNGTPVPIGTYYYVIRTSIRSYSGWVFVTR